MSVFILPQEPAAPIIGFDVATAINLENNSEITDHAVEAGSDASDHVHHLPERIAVEAFVSNHPIRSSIFDGRSATRARARSLAAFAIPARAPTFESQRLTVPQPSPSLSLTPTGLAVSGAKALIGALLGPPVFSATTLHFEGRDFAREVYEELIDLERNGVLCRVISRLRDYDDMIITKVAAPLSVDDGLGATLSIELRKIRIVETGFAAVPPVPDEPRGAPGVNGGAKGKTSASGPASTNPTDSASILFRAGQSVGAF